MLETFLGAVIVAAVLTLLVLHIAIAVILIRLLKTLKRATDLIKSIVDDAENAVKIIRNIRAPLAWGRALSKIAGHFAAATDNKNKKQ